MNARSSACMALLISIVNLLAALPCPRQTGMNRGDRLMPYRAGDMSLIIPDEQ